MASIDRRETAWLSGLILVSACAYALFGVLRHWHFGSSAFDLGIFDQAVWHLSRFETPASTIVGLPNLFGDHFHPIITLFAPLYWIAPQAETLIVAQAVLFALSAVPVFLFARARLPFGPSLSLTIAYALFWGLQRAIAFDVHEIAFAPLAIATAILAIDRRQWPLFWAMALLLVVVKEDLIPLVAFFGVYLFMRGERRQGAVLAIGGVMAFLLVVRVILPSLNPAGAYPFAAPYRGVIERPWTIPAALVTPPGKLLTAALWVAPFACLPLLSDLSLLLIPFVLTRLLSTTPAHWSTIFHYSAPLAPIVAMAAADGLARLGRRLRHPQVRMRVVYGVAGLAALLSSILPERQPLWTLFSPRHYQSSASATAGYDVLRRVPRDASVVAQAAIAPHLSERNRIYMLDRTAPDADYVIADGDASPWPLETAADVASLIRDRRNRGYRVVAEQQGWTLLAR